RILGGRGTRARPGDDHIDLRTNEFVSKLRETIKVALSEAKLECEVLTVDPAELAEPLPQRRKHGRLRCDGEGRQPPDPRNFNRLLRSRRQRPAYCYATKQHDEVPPSQVAHAAPSPGATAILDRPAAAAG